MTMRYFSFVEPKYDDRGDIVDDEVQTWSEEDVREKYYPHWKATLIEKIGEERFEELFSFPDCLDDWIVANWAWEVDDDD